LVPGKRITTEPRAQLGVDLEPKDLPDGPAEPAISYKRDQREHGDQEQNRVYRHAANERQNEQDDCQCEKHQASFDVGEVQVPRI
jgi:hypothetical protein